MSKFPKLDEDKDIFLVSLNKKFRNLNKKLRDIEELEKQASDSLKQEQKAKIQSKSSLKENVAEIEKIKSFYFKAYEENQQEIKNQSGNVPLPKAENSQQLEKVKTQTTNTFLHLVLLGTYLTTYPECHLPLDINAQQIVSLFKRAFTFGDQSHKSLIQQVESSQKVLEEYLDTQLQIDIDNFLSSSEAGDLIIKPIASHSVVPKHETPTPEPSKREEKPSYHEVHKEQEEPEHHEKHEVEVVSKQNKWEDYDEEPQPKKHEEHQEHHEHHEHHEDHGHGHGYHQENYEEDQHHHHKSPYRGNNNHHNQYYKQYEDEQQEEEQPQEDHHHEHHKEKKPESQVDADGFIEVKSRFRGLGSSRGDRPYERRGPRGNRRGGGRGYRRGGGYENRGEQEEEHEGQEGGERRG